MLDQQIRTCEVNEPRVLDVLRSTPREAWAPPGFRDMAFADMAIPIGHGQKMLTPQIEGRILQSLDIQSIDEILEIGTGTGYLSACLARLGASVHSLDIFAEFVSSASRRFDEQRITGIRADVADATTYDFDTKYDVVVISAALPKLSDRYTDLLKPGGRLFVFTGEAPVMKAKIVTRQGETLLTESLFESLVEPLINARSDSAFEL